MVNYQSHTKIVATIGPASNSHCVLKEMILKGIDVCRLNFSHGDHQSHKQVIDLVRQLNKELNTSVALLADLQGPKLRIGKIENNELLLNENDEVVFTNMPCKGNSEKIYMSYERFPIDVTVGDIVLIDDGKLKLEVIHTNRKDTVKAKVLYGGILSSNKGVNLPNTKISLPSLTKKDLQDLTFALEQNVDWVALSFVRQATDIIDIKEIIKKHHKHLRVIAKIEKPEALKEIKNIIDLADGIMIARGDLGVEVPFNEVPVIQKQIVEQCIKASKPVIIATQMMESMITNFSPSRAEATDVANAVIDGADALMLSGETSVSKHPIKVIESMQSIICNTEKHAYKFYEERPLIFFSKTFMPDSICLSAIRLAKQAQADAIVTYTNSGYTTKKISSYRPEAPIFSFTPNTKLLGKMPLIWGVRAYYFDKYDSIEIAINYTIDFLLKQKLIKHDQVIIHVGSIPLIEHGTTNMLKISYI